MCLLLQAEEGPTVRLTEEQFQMVLQELGDWAISFDARCSKTRALTYTSFVCSPKMPSLPSEWQSPKSCRTIVEVEGNDDSKNLKANSLKFWIEVLEIYLGKPVVANIGGRKVDVRMNFKFPADMSSHWSACDTTDAKGFIHADSQVCQRCRVTYSQLGVVFDLHTVLVGDTLNSIAKRYGIDVRELQLINLTQINLNQSDTEDWTANLRAKENKMARYHQTKVETSEAEEAAKKGKETTTEYTPTIFTNAKGKTVSCAMLAKLFANPDQPLLEAMSNPSGVKTIRVHKVWAMDRPIPESAVWHGVDHLDCPFCMEHATQRTTEFLLNILLVNPQHQ